jgi:tetratricopeptide (TPR) repeat protein
MVKAHSLGRVYSSLALSRYEAGDLTEATRYLGRGFATQRVVGECAGCDVTLYPSAVPIYIALGDLDMAEEICGKAEAAAGAFRSRAWFGTSRYLNGLLASARNEWERAYAQLSEAVAIFDELQQPYELARAQQELAIAKIRLNDDSVPSPSELLTLAIDSYTALGAPYRAGIAQQLLGSIHRTKG